MIEPNGIPIEKISTVVTALEQNVPGLSGLGQQFTDLGNNVHNTFQRLNGVYHAPEREVLVNSTKKIQTNLTEFGPSLPAMSRHLTNLTGDVRGKLGTLKDIREEAYEWHRRKNRNPEWKNDQDMIDDNNRMVEDVRRIVREEIPNLCFSAANEIVKLHGGKPWDPKTGVREGEKPPEQKEQDGDPPPEAWGTSEERDKPLWQDCLEFPVNFVVGVATVVGETLEGLLTLIPVLPAIASIPGVRDWAKDKLGWDMPTWEDAGNAWKGLGLMVAHLATAPIELAWWGFDQLTGLDTRPDAVKSYSEQGAQMGLGMVKGFVAWDEWAKNPGKAFGMALTNVVATVASGGSAGAIKTAAMAGKFGAASMAVAKVAKVAEFAQGTRIAMHDGILGAVTKIPKVGDVVGGLSKIPIVGDTFKLQGVPKIDVPSTHTPDVSSSDTPDISTPSDTPDISTPSDTPDVSTPAAHANAPTVDSPSVDTPAVHDTGGTPQSPVSDAPSAPLSHADPSTTSPAAHTGPGTTAPGGNTPAPTTQLSAPTTHAPDTQPTPGTSRAPESGTPSTSRAPESSTPSTSRAPESTTPGTSRAPESSAPSTSRTPESTTPGTSRAPESTTPGTSRAPESTTPGTTRTPDGQTTPGTSRGPESSAPGSTRAPDSTTPSGTRTPDSTSPSTTRTPDSTTAPGTTRTPEPSTPSSHTPGTSHTPDSPGTHTPESGRPGPTRTPESTTPGRTPEPSTPSTHTPGTSHTPDSPSTHTPETPGTHTPRTPESGTPHTPDSTTPGRTPESTTPGTHTPETPGTHTPRTPESGTPHTPDSTTPGRTPESTTPGTHTPETPGTRTPETPGTRTPETPGTHTPETPGTHTPETPGTRTPEPGRAPDVAPAARNADPVVQPVMPVHPGVPGHVGGSHGTPNAPHSNAPGTPNAPHSNAPGTPNAPHSNAPGAPNRPHDAANDPKWDDPLRRQVEIDRLKPDYLRPEPGKPRSMVDPHQHIPARREDPRWGELTDSVGDPPVSNVPDWVGRVNPDHDLSPHYRMNCPDISRNVADILNGGEPRLASGNAFKSGEDPEGTLEWMDLDDFRPEHKMAAPQGPHNPADFTNAAYRRVYDALTGKPPGTHANIFVTWKGGTGGHVFNAFVDEGGRVKFLDAQPPGGKLVDSFPPGHTSPHPVNPYHDANGRPVDIDSIMFATREPGGRWDGIPRSPNTPPASQLRFQRDVRPVSGAPDVPNASPSIADRLNPPDAPTRTPDPASPTTSRPEGRAPESGTPSSRSEPPRHTDQPESHTPEQPHHAPGSHAPNGHTPDPHAPQSRTP
ncbi:toxin glutamine deamidase domain-containing protein, partial [Kribbella sp. NPDC049227]|uniref:toxin glutamine deamidase domain-containing protein n=1 Tax=Kribbella sp. NPDC049227 TaxID=3364113 RepID=UPI00370F91F8